MDEKTCDDLRRKVKNSVDDNSQFGTGFFGLQPNFHDTHMVPRRKSFNGVQKAV